MMHVRMKVINGCTVIFQLVAEGHTYCVLEFRVLYWKFLGMSLFLLFSVLSWCLTGPIPCFVVVVGCVHSELAISGRVFISG